MKVYITRSPWSDCFEVRLAKESSKKLLVCEAISYVDLRPGEIHSPTMILEREEAQVLINALYDAGLRPSQAAGSAGQLSATLYHLEDMRKLVFK